MSTLDYIQRKFQIDLSARSPIEIHLSRHGGLPELWRELGFKTGAEIGVEQGKYSNHILRHVPGLKLYCIDPWCAYSRYADEMSQGKLDAYYLEARERLRGMNCEIYRTSSMDAASQFEPDSIDFCYIDGNHDFEFVVNDIIAWSKIVRPGGIVAGHDYKNEQRNHRIPFHVVQAVNAYTDSYKIKPWFILRGDKCASWMWVKPDGGSAVYPIVE